MIDRIGQQFGNYRLTHLLGKGGFAEVYLGEHIHLNSQVAIKILHTKFVSHEQNEFLHEARTIAALEHPSIVRILDCGIERDAPFLIMNYAPHGTLRQQYLKGTQVSLVDIVAHVHQIASALQYAHDHKVIHCDIKPENMLLGRNREVLLSDFGISLISSSSASQSVKAIAGTVSYISPEQVLGKPRIASDQYALGIVVYEWLCGNLPFHGSFHEVCAQHLYATPHSLREHNATVAPAVEAVVMKALAKEPEQRFTSIQEFATALAHSSQPTVSLHSAPSSRSNSQNEFIIVKHKVDAQGIPNTGNDAPTYITPKVNVSPVSGHTPTTLPPLAPVAPRHSGLKLSLIVATGLLALVLLVTSPFLYTMASSSLSSNKAVGVGKPSPTSSSGTVVQIVPTQQPTAAPTQQSTQQPTVAPTQQPTQQPTASPTQKPVQRQVSAQQSQSKTVNATGQGTTPGTRANGTLTFYNYSSHTDLSFNAGSTFSNDKTPAIQMVLDTSVTLPAVTGGPTSAIVQAHVVQRGVVGNVGVTGFVSSGPIDPNTNRSIWSVENGSAFSGGSDAQTYTKVLQSDIDSAVSPLKTTTTQQASDELKSSLKSNEHLVGSPQCTSTVTADHVANDEAKSVTVTVATSCTETAST